MRGFDVPAYFEKRDMTSSNKGQVTCLGRNRVDHVIEDNASSICMYICMCEIMYCTDASNDDMDISMHR